MYQKLIWGEPARHFDHSNDQLFEQDEYIYIYLNLVDLIRFFY